MRVHASFYLLVLAALYGTVWAQAAPPATPRKQPMLQLGVGFSGVTYLGDHNYRNESYYRIHPAAHLSLQFDNYRRVSPQLNFSFSRIRAENRDLAPQAGVQPNTFFSTRYFSLDLRMRIRFNRLGRLRPHLAPGLGLLSYTPQDRVGNSLANQLDTRKEGEDYSSTTILFPLNLGVTYRLNELVSLGADFTHFLTGTDYFDNVGELGPRSGNDRLQELSFTVYITPSQRERAGRH
jgi:hypothetical protein